MSASDQLYAELKPDIGAVAEALFDTSKELLRRLGNFVPHGAVLSEQDEVTHVGADPYTGSDLTKSTVVLPILHDGLRQLNRERALKAIGVAENVTITLEGKRPTKAIKVLFEHKRGLTTALYVPFEKKFLRGYAFGPAFALAAKPEVNAWSTGTA